MRNLFAMLDKYALLSRAPWKDFKEGEASHSLFPEYKSSLNGGRCQGCLSYSLKAAI